MSRIAARICVGCQHFQRRTHKHGAAWYEGYCMRTSEADYHKQMSDTCEAWRPSRDKLRQLLELLKRSEQQGGES